MDSSKLKALFPFRSRHKIINGHRYNYIDEGKGRPVIMLHGNPTWSFYFRRLIGDLSDRYRTIAVDHIGCGLSEKPPEEKYEYTLKNRVDDLEALISELDPGEKITLVVHDWGGMIGSAYALRHPDKIASIVVTNTAGFFTPGSKKLPLRLWLLKKFRFLARIGILRFNLFAGSAVFMASSRGLSRDVKKGLLFPYDNAQNRIATLKFVEDIPVNEDDPSYGLVNYVDRNLHRLSSIPMLICWGMDDFVFNESYLNEWQRRFPGAEVHSFSSSGHYLLEDEPEIVSELIGKFLDRN